MRLDVSEQWALHRKLWSGKKGTKWAELEKHQQSEFKREQTCSKSSIQGREKRGDYPGSWGVPASSFRDFDTAGHKTVSPEIDPGLNVVFPRHKIIGSPVWPVWIVWLFPLPSLTVSPLVRAGCFSPLQGADCLSPFSPRGARPPSLICLQI